MLKTMATARANFTLSMNQNCRKGKTMTDLKVRIQREKGSLTLQEVEIPKQVPQ